MKPVVVVGKNYSTTLGVIRSLGIAGYNVWLLHMGWDTNSSPFIAAQSRFVSRYEYASFRDTNSLVNVLLSKYITEGCRLVLIPTDDVSAQIIDLSSGVLKNHFFLPSVNNLIGGIDSFMNKSIQKTFASECGFNVAQSWLVSIREGVFSIPSGVIFPCITKPVSSNNSNKKDLKICNNVDELQTALTILSQRRDFDVLIEELLTIDHEYTITGYAWGEYSFFPYVIKKIRTAVCHRGVTSIGELCQSSEFEIMDTLLFFMKKLQYYGLCDIELIESNGKFYFNEMNLRNGAPLFAITRAGVNLPDLLVRRYLGEPNVESVPYYSPSLRFVSEKAEYDDYIDGVISFSAYLKDVNSVGIGLIKWEEDMGPYNLYKKMVCRSVVVRNIPFRKVFQRVLNKNR